VPLASNRGGFRVAFEHLGPADTRARYKAEARTIYVNLDHPQVRAGGGDVDGPPFRRLAFEAAATEYAVAVAEELAREGEFAGDATEAMKVVRETLDRISRAGAGLYAPPQSA
jgi:hypothetical protein